MMKYLTDDPTKYYPSGIVFHETTDPWGQHVVEDPVQQLANRTAFIEQMVAGGGVDVRKYGAVGDGVTNDTAAIQSAVAAATAALSGIVFGAGTYVVDSVAISVPAYFPTTSAGAATLMVNSGETVTMDRIDAYPDRQIFDTSAGGTVTILAPQTIYVRWYGDGTSAFKEALEGAPSGAVVELARPILAEGQITLTMPDQAGLVIRGTSRREINHGYVAQGAAVILTGAVLGGDWITITGGGTQQECGVLIENIKFDATSRVPAGSAIMRLEAVNAVTIKSCIFNRSLGRGVWIGGTVICNRVHIEGGNFHSNAEYGLLGETTGDCRMHDSDAGGCGVGYHLEAGWTITGSCRSWLCDTGIELIGPRIQADLIHMNDSDDNGVEIDGEDISIDRMILEHNGMGTSGPWSQMGCVIKAGSDRIRIGSVSARDRGGGTPLNQYAVVGIESGVFDTYIGEVLGDGWTNFLVYNLSADDPALTGERAWCAPVPYENIDISVSGATVLYYYKGRHKKIEASGTATAITLTPASAGGNINDGDELVVQVRNEVQAAPIAVTFNTSGAVPVSPAEATENNSDYWVFRSVAGMWREVEHWVEQVELPRPRIVCKEYDFSVSGGGVGDFALGYLPDNATITRAWYEILTPFTSGGATTVAFGVHTDDAVGLHGSAMFNDADYAAGYHDFLPDGTAANFTTKTTAVRAVIMTVGAVDLTAGKVRVWYEYVWSA